LLPLIPGFHSINKIFIKIIIELNHKLILIIINEIDFIYFICGYIL